MANDNRDYDAFIAHIAALDIELSVNQDGVYTVCTTAEPYFCYDADTQEEAAHLVAKTLVSYGNKFFGLTELQAPVIKPAKDSSGITVERGTPIGQLKPIFDLAA